MAATPILCEILGITLLGVFWYFGIGTMLWIVTLLIPIYLMVKVSNVPFPITRALVVVACMIAISIVWIKYVLSAKWFLDVLGWFIIVSQPVGFVIALLLVPICAFLFVWACTAILIGLDALLVTVGRKSQQARDDRAMESHSLLARDNDGDEYPSAAVTIKHHSRHRCRKQHYRSPHDLLFHAHNPDHIGKHPPSAFTRQHRSHCACNVGSEAGGIVGTAGNEVV